MSRRASKRRKPRHVVEIQCDSDDEIELELAPRSKLPKPVKRRRSDISGEMIEFDGAVWRRLVWLGAPLVFFNVLWSLHMAGQNAPSVYGFQDFPPSMFFECFCGAKACTRAFEFNLGDTAALGVDLAQHVVHQNVMSTSGFLTHVVAVKNMRRPIAYGHYGTVCTSWAATCRASTGRTDDKPWGNWQRSACTMHGNVMVSRTTILQMLMVALTIIWSLDQPASSSQVSHPKLYALMLKLGAALRQVHSWLGAFGARTAKPIRLYGTAPFLDKLLRTVDARLTLDADRTAVSWQEQASGKRRWTGNKERMKPTQEYPPALGEAMFSAWREWATEGHTGDDIALDHDSGVSEDPDEDPWYDAELERIASHLDVSPSALFAPFRAE